MPLAVPLFIEQISAAKRIHDRLEQWRAADRALLALRGAFPDYGADACLLKCVAVNSLYGTNVYAILRMANHVCRVMNDAARPKDHVQLVEALAKLPPKTGETQKNHTSFASKFAHFFESNEVPIYDSFAIKTLMRHLGEGCDAGDPKRPYATFTSNLRTLQHEACLQVSVRDLDRYLWLAGQFAARNEMLAKPGSVDKMNRELAEVLRDPDPELLPDFAALAGSTFTRGRRPTTEHS
jgi:hypothetical protein